MVIDEQSQQCSPMRDILQRLLEHPGGVAGAVVTLCFFAMAVMAPWLSPYDPLAQDLNRRLQAPSRAHLLGTDDFGRDILSRVMHGARISLTIGFISVGIAVAGGLVLGLVAGFYTAGRWGRLIDIVIMRTSDILLAFPAVLLAIAIVTASALACAMPCWRLPSSICRALFGSSAPVFWWKKNKPTSKPARRLGSAIDDCCSDIFCRISYRR
jgi:ABC-type dipeptide/oligopeptide/nickel transport system permease subunit